MQPELEAREQGHDGRKQRRNNVPPEVEEEPPCLANYAQLVDKNDYQDDSDDDDGRQCAGASGDVRGNETVDGDMF